MKPKTSTPQFLMVVLSAAVLSVLTALLAAPVLRILLSVYGSKKYWLSGLALSLGLVSLGRTQDMFLLSALWVMVGVYTEAEYRGFSGIGYGFIAILTGTFVFIGGLFTWFYVNGVELLPTLRMMAEEGLKSLGLKEQSVEALGYVINADFIINLTPSFIFLLLTSCLAVGLMTDRWLAALCGLPFEKSVKHLKLLEFKMPDPLIWLVMASFALSFYRVPQAWVNFTALNIFNVLMGLYFFQGLAVLEMSFWFFRIGTFMRWMFYVFIIGQLFFLLSVVGVIDYWVDFRGRMKKSRAAKSAASGL